MAIRDDDIPVGDTVMDTLRPEACAHWSLVGTFIMALKDSVGA